MPLSLSSFVVGLPAGLVSSSSGCSSSSGGSGVALSFSGAGRFGRCAAVRRLAAAVGHPAFLFFAPGFLVLVVGAPSAASSFGRARPWLRVVGVPPLVAPPARSVRLLASGFCAVGAGLRFSSRSFSGVVAVVRFPYRSAARAFAPVAARLAGVPVVVRGLAVSVPVAPFSRVAVSVSLRRVF